MRKTAKQELSTDYEDRIMLDTMDLAQMLSCGRQTAVKIGTSADARVQIGKRVLWNTRKIREYLDNVQEVS